MPMQKEITALSETAARMFSGPSGKISRMDYEPQKLDADDLQNAGKGYFQRVSPESVGISSLYIYDLIKDLNKAAFDLHHIMMLRHGKVFTECSFAPYRKNTPHIMNGIAKSLTGLAIGMLVDERKISTESRMTEIFGSKISFLNSLKLKNITVYDLLTMSSGTAFDITAAQTGNDWMSMFFDAPLRFEPGTKFDYNSMNSYILSAAVTMITGLPMDEYLKKKLFDPLGIGTFFWEKCPRGITKGGWGLYMRSEDIARIAMLYLNKGICEDKKIVSPEWINESVTMQKSTGDGAFSGYGYHIWTGDRIGDCLLSGALMQECFVFPDNDMIIVINAGSSKNDGYIRDLINDRFGGDYKAPAFLVENPSSYRMLKALTSSFSFRSAGIRQLKGGWGRKRSGLYRQASSENLKDTVNDLSYVLENKTHGIMPLMMQFMHNNISEGLSEISFEKDSDGLIIHLKEGDELNNLAVGLKKDRFSVLNIKGELYLVAAFGSFSQDEDGDICLKVECAFIEEACRRFIKIFFKDDRRRIKIELSESPGEDMTASLPDDKRCADITPVIKGHRKNLYENIGENILWARP